MTTKRYQKSISEDGHGVVGCVRDQADGDNIVVKFYGVGDEMEGAIVDTMNARNDKIELQRAIDEIEEIGRAT